MKSSTKIFIAETLTDILYVTLWVSALRALGINFSLIKTYFIVYLIAIVYVTLHLFLFFDISGIFRFSNNKGEKGKPLSPRKILDCDYSAIVLAT